MPSARATDKAVDYGRYSNEIQSDASIEDQARICQERIRREGWTYLRSYQDRAMSGASRLRPAYQQLLEDARRGQFNIVVAESLDRLSRDQEDVAHPHRGPELDARSERRRVDTADLRRVFVDEYAVDLDLFHDAPEAEHPKIRATDAYRGLDPVEVGPQPVALSCLNLHDPGPSRP